MEQQNQYMYMDTTMNPLVMMDEKNLRQETIDPITGKPYDGMVLEGIFACLESLNRNSRVYNVESYLVQLNVLRQAIHSPKGLYGELEHPEGYAINFNNVSHKILDVWYDDKTKCVMGRLMLLNTEKGKICQEIVRSGGQLAVSARAAGIERKQNDGTKVCDVTMIVTYDIVYHPGFADANLTFVKLNESFQMMLNDAKSNDSVKIGYSVAVPVDKLHKLNESYDIYLGECREKGKREEPFVSWLERNVDNIDKLNEDTQDGLTVGEQQRLQDSDPKDDVKVENELKTAAEQLDEGEDFDENDEELKKQFFQGIQEVINKKKLKKHDMHGSALYDGSAGFLKRDDDWNENVNNQGSSGKHGYVPSGQVFTPNGGDVSSTFNGAPAGNNDIA